MGDGQNKRNSIMRVAFVAISVFTQIGWILLRILQLNQYSEVISVITAILSAVVVLRLYSRHTTSAMKLPWIMLILLFPVMGLTLYLLIVFFGDLGSAGKRLNTVRRNLAEELHQDETVLTRLAGEDLAAANQCRYLWNQTGSPAYENTKADYYAEACAAFEAMKAELEKAESFIFMEYFAVEDGESFREVREILARKAREGVEVRLLYDDIGSIGFANMRFATKLNREGIQCRVFNPALPVLNLFMNHRDHRKITVVDGKVGFTGGFNLANEYFGVTQPFGHWKDTGLRLEGEAVRSLTAAFLELWNVTGKTDGTADREYLQVCHRADGGGIVQPYTDNPLGTERVAEDVFLNLISHAEKTVYFTTPYLIITDELIRAFGLAAKRGVDVRIITPGIPDKRMVYQITRSYYAGLARHGVRIFEYTPGFCHAKQCICDGKIVSIGTSNLDYRSLYLHFENDVLLYGCDAVEKIAGDFEEMFPRCQEVTEQYRSGRGAMLRLWQMILRLFAPLV